MKGKRRKTEGEKKAQRRRTHLNKIGRIKKHNLATAKDTKTRSFFEEKIAFHQKEAFAK